MKKHINIGEVGETPKKISIFNRDDPASSLSLATPQRSNNNNIKSVLRTSKNEFMTNNNSNIDDRPKTSRGKAMPSPDEFADYVIPSPPKQTKKEVDDIFEQYNVNSKSSTFPDFKKAIWSDNRTLQCNQPNFDSDEDDEEDEDERILAERAKKTNLSSSNIFSTSVRHSNQDDFLKNNWFGKDCQESSDSGDNFDKYYDNYDDDDDDDDDDDMAELVSDNDYDDDDYNDYSDDDDDDDDFGTYGYDEKNPILTDDRMIALGCWLFGTALKV